MRERERNRVCVREEKVGRGKERGEGREGGRHTQISPHVDVG